MFHGASASTTVPDMRPPRWDPPPPEPTGTGIKIHFGRTVTSDEVPPELQLSRPANRPDRMAEVVVQFLDSIATMQQHNMQFQQSMMEQQMAMQAQNMNLMQQLACNGKGYLITI